MLLLLSTGPWPVYAECVEQRDIAVWPDEYAAATIQPRQLFLFSAGSRTNGRLAILDFGRQTQVYLWSKHDSVPLLLLDQTVNPLSSDLQVLMQPVRPLLPDTVYHLRTSLPPPAGYSLFRMQRARAGSNQLIIAHRWRVSSALSDTQAPRWTATPAVLHKEYSSNSEGINNFVQFSYPMLDASPVLVRATIRSARQAQPVVSYLTPWQNQLGIGWFTCGGNFAFGPSEDCTVTFEALDAAGNRSLATGRPISFRGPRPEQAAAKMSERKTKIPAPRR
ncbi:hypothetical protein KBK19_09525 [Microvirga sp. STR05]|uniref:Uncharacterized protein n=1 Tax=Hymenobacter duratus TaxID=2771356 RepID=A0ABR8JKE8_9BACT|nr:hypothetical protein [Hymenobacter duratus]MBD2715274.1 hypothetical protein [Hymenobacter duratus]MBR7950181.1 hypothetical protein [Microvirga sp. STR05]